MQGDRYVQGRSVGLVFQDGAGWRHKSIRPCGLTQEQFVVGGWQVLQLESKDFLHQFSHGFPFVPARSRRVPSKKPDCRHRQAIFQGGIRILLPPLWGSSLPVEQAARQRWPSAFVAPIGQLPYPTRVPSRRIQYCARLG